MEVYFIRHGQTSGNAAKRHQHNDSRLTILGEEQAARAAHAVAAVKPTHLVVSARVRAVETGQAVATVTGLTPVVSEAVVELHRPRSFYGNYHLSAQTVWFMIRWFFGNIGGPGEVPEGESYTSMLQRITETKTFLTALPADARVVIVSHSIFISFFVAHLNVTHRLGPWRGVWALLRALRLPNGSITHVHYDPVKTRRPWELKQFAKTKVYTR